MYNSDFQNKLVVKQPIAVSQRFSNLFFCDPKLLKTTIYKYDCDPNKYE